MPESRTLFVMRHAKSDWGSPTLDDHDRPLNPRGKRDAPRMARWLMKNGIAPDCIAASSALRARTTAEMLRETWKNGVRLELYPQLYLAGPESYLKIASSLDDTIQSPIFIGHNPGLEELVALLTGETVEMPTAAIAEIQLPVRSWKEVARNSKARLKNFWKPKALPDDFT